MNLAKTMLAIAAGAAVGVTTMYYLDPQNGRRRRALVADRVGATRHRMERAATGTRKRWSDRTRGMMASFRSRVTGRAEPMSDGQLEGRVRAHLGHVLGYPKAIETHVDQGCVRLEGHVLERDLEPLLAELKAIPGVRRIYNRLEVHQTAENDPMLQDHRQHPRPGSAARRGNGLDRPAMKALAVAAPLALLASLGAGAWRNGRAVRLR